MQTDAISASETSTSALMSKAVTRPMTASRMIGRPHSTMAIHAMSKGSGWTPSRLPTTATPETGSSVTSFRMPPHSNNSSNFPIRDFMQHTFCFDGFAPVRGSRRRHGTFLYTHLGIATLYI